MEIRTHVNNPELILSAIALHAVFALFARSMKVIIDRVSGGTTNLILTEIISSFMFVALVFEKGLWYKNVNEIYFHFGTMAQVIFWITFMPGKANPCSIVARDGILKMLIVFPFQILGGLSGSIFMRKVFWPLGMTLFHLSHNPKCVSTMNTDLSTGVFIESTLVSVLMLAPILERSIGRRTGFGEYNAVLIGQALAASYAVKSYIEVTGAMMNPLLAVIVNFDCFRTQDHIVEHMLYYWAGPMTVAFILGLLEQRATPKQKEE